MTDIVLKQFKKAGTNDLRFIPWYMKNPTDRPPNVRLFEKQTRLNLQFYRYFNGEYPKARLTPENSNKDLNPWHWKEKEVIEPDMVHKIIIEQPSQNVQDIVELVQQRQLHGDGNEWSDLGDFFEPDEIRQAKDILGV